MTNKLTTEEANALACSCIPLACKIANRLARPGNPSDELVGVALLALTKASRFFDPDRNIRFTTYASRAVELELFKHINREYQRFVERRVPISPEMAAKENREREILPIAVVEAIGKLHTVDQYVINNYLSGKTQQEMADELGVSGSRIGQKWQRACQRLRKLLAE